MILHDTPIAPPEGLQAKSPAVCVQDQTCPAPRATPPQEDGNKRKAALDRAKQDKAAKELAGLLGGKAGGGWQQQQSPSSCSWFVGPLSCIDLQ